MNANNNFCRRAGRALIFLCALGFFVAHAFAAAGTLTVATYNLENYNSAGRMADGVHHDDYPKPESQKTALRAVIRQMDADVLALQEMGPAPYLEELRRDLKSEGLDYPFAVVLEADGLDPARHLAVLSKRPFTSVVRHADLTFKYFSGVERVKRGLLEVRLAAGGAEWTFFVVHLKSKLTERADDPESALERAGEAEAVRDRVLKIFSDPAKAKFLILGDCNAGRTERPLRALLEKGKTTIAEWVPAADSRGEVWTEFWRQRDTYERIDHALVSPGLRPSVVAAKIFDSAETMAASDHRPVVVTLRTE
jgi:endonuclease/exonuclease/phosphatase family metal-dependent hydrolase